MSGRDRVNRLEAEEAPERCEGCKNWAAYRVARVNDPHTMAPVEMPPPKRCHRCGFEPVTLAIGRVDDGRWR
jgi:hypothetical protein